MYLFIWLLGSSSLTRDWTQPPTLGVQSLSYWTTSKVPRSSWCSCGTNNTPPLPWLVRALAGTFVHMPATWKTRPHTLEGRATRSSIFVLLHALLLIHREWCLIRHWMDGHFGVECYLFQVAEGAVVWAMCVMRVGWVVGLGLGIQTGEENLVRELEREIVPLDSLSLNSFLAEGLKVEKCAKWRVFYTTAVSFQDYLPNKAKSGFLGGLFWAWRHETGKTT